MNQPVTNKSENNLNLFILLATVSITIIVIVAILFRLDLLAIGENQTSKPMVHTEGMVHTEDMVHTDELHVEMITSRQEEVADRGSMVMPFDLERTTHIFNTIEFGGVQQVISDDGDLHQIELIQAHLEEEAERFQAGDFGDPSLIHGHDMPGLAELEAGYEQIEVMYEAMSDGGQITYTTADENMKVAIHQWFEAQLADHGAHAKEN